jgi:FKBP-type peptidyl-prolyl cis-trans isomerase
MYWHRWAGVLAVAGVAACGRGGATLTTLADSASYAAGMNLGASLRQVRDDVSMEALVQGLRDMVEGDTTRLSEGDAMRVLQTFGAQLRAKQDQEQTAMADSNAMAGAAYRAENGKREGVRTTASGLQYEVLTAGSGPRPAATDRVRVHYRGTLIDGKEFDSSYRGGQPVTFTVTEVIGGWTEGLQLMNVGGKARLVIPPELGYGPQGAPPDIGPNATLIFEVELLAIEK